MPSTSPNQSAEDDGAILSEVQVILAEKRTSLAVMRTGIAIFVLPLSVVSALIATSKLYDVADIIHLLIPLLVLCAGLVVLAIFLIVRSLVHLRRYDGIILKLKRSHGKLAEFID